MKILFCGYREWALDVYRALLQQYPDMQLVEDPKAMEILARGAKWDVILGVGWSWKVPADIVNSNAVVGVHPSDLPKYAGGSPIQNQILDGIEETNATLFRFNEQFDKGEIADKEPISLKGHLHEILENIACASVIMLHRFLKQFPNNVYAPQKGRGKSVKRLKPADSQLPNPIRFDQFNEEHEMTCKELWDFIRCREDPYPNAYFEDDTGKLIIKWVEFEPKDRSGS